MAEKTLVTFNLDEDRKDVWEDEAEDRGRSLSGFIRHAGEREIAGGHETDSGGVDHSEELSEIQTMVRGLVASVDSVDETVGVIRREMSVSDEVKKNIPNIVSLLPKQEEGAITTEEIRKDADMTELRIIQCLNHAEEQTSIVGRDTDTEEGVQRFYRKV